MSGTTFLYHKDSQDLLFETLDDYKKSSCFRTRQVYSFISMDESEVRESRLKDHISECPICLEEYGRVHRKLEELAREIPEAKPPLDHHKKFKLELAKIVNDYDKNGLRKKFSLQKLWSRFSH